jgi:hypothetical protein
LMPIGIALLIAAHTYSTIAQGLGGSPQARYFQLLLPLYGALLALAVRGARPWGREIGAAIVVLAIGHEVSGQLVTIGRFYG